MNTNITNRPDRPELLQYAHPNGEIVQLTNYGQRDKLGHFAVYYSYAGGQWVYSGITPSPENTVKAWHDALGADNPSIPAFAFQELTARAEVLA